MLTFITYIFSVVAFWYLAGLLANILLIACGREEWSRENLLEDLHLGMILLVLTLCALRVSGKYKKTLDTNNGL